MNVSYDELQKKLEAAESNVEKFIALAKANEQLAVIAQNRANRAEARIKASQEQEPVGRVVSSGEYNLPCLEWLSANHSLETQIGSMLFTQPIIPPELAELQRENADLKAWKEKMQSGSRIVKENEELTRKLAEHQAAFVRMGYVGKVDGKEELERLLSEARKGPVGWKLVPVEPTSGMIQAGRMQFYHTPGAHWKAMLAASPEYKERT